MELGRRRVEVVGLREEVDLAEVADLGYLVAAEEVRRRVMVGAPLGVGGRLAAPHPQTFDHVYLVGCSSRVWGHELFLDVSRRAEDDETIHLVRRASPGALRGVSNNPQNGFCFGLLEGLTSTLLQIIKSSSSSQTLGKSSS